MFIKPIRLSLAVIGLLSFLGIGLVGTSSITSYSLNAADFDSYVNTCYFANTGDSLYFYNPNGCNHFISGLHLPDGVTLTRITLFYTDGSESDAKMYLFRKDTIDTASTIIATIDNTGIAGVPTSKSWGEAEGEDPILINNALYSYFVMIEIPTVGINVWGVRFDTTNYLSFLSLIRK